MKAIVLKDFGGPENFELAEVEKPSLKPGHVLVRVAASSVNPVDYKIRSGLLEVIAPDEPRILACDVAGVVEEVGDGVTKFNPGDEVYGCPGGSKGNPGALAEYMLADADLLALRPKSIPLEDCAALPLVTITAWDGLIDRTKIKPGDKVLVHAATGGVGHIGIQLAKMAGAQVFVTASSDEKIAIGKSLGADAGINYRESSVADYVEEHTGGKGFNVVFDTVGGEMVEKSFQAAALHGTVVSVNTRVTCDLSELHKKALTFHVVFMILPLLTNDQPGRAHQGEIVKTLTGKVDAGEIKPLIHAERFPFERVADAHRLLESGKAIGKIVLQGFK